LKNLDRSDMWPYQLAVAKHVQSDPYKLFAVSLGLGKTVSWLTGYQELLNSFDACHALAFAPLRVARKVWTDEINRWSHLNGITVSRVIGTPQQRWDALNRRADLHITNRDNIPWIEAQFVEGTGKKFKQIRRFPWDTVVVDESQSLKNPTGVWFKSMARLRRLHEIQRMHLLSGTPTPNGYMDLYGQIYLLDQGKRLGRRVEDYRDRWFDCDPYAHTYKLKSPAAKKEIQALVADLVLVMRGEDYLAAPKVIYNNVMIEMTGKARDTYDRMKRKYLAELNGVTVTAVNAGVCCGKLLQLANGAVYYEEGKWQETHREKLSAMCELLDSADGPVMIAYGYKHDTERILKTLQLAFGKTKSFRVLDTEQDEDDWNAGKIDYLLLHPASAGHGLNLQHSGSETIIWFGLTSNLEWYQQLNARLIGGHRAGGRTTVIHHILAEDTYDENMVALLKNKDAEQDDLKLAILRLTSAG
jgi:hypothetical protein